ncbi:hypothetical protein [Paraurantiacibacter namhicola]|uniref:Uncharacterized protein n=1 Tax=Paraurantiacibacter namhicola TaxID=645517 RepID=A0A1C7D614_9SPHN|nr:hypothetical protein [Paraurantiacibacter namhicola]ANU06898.1 hypothetical protein A6F65_00575 [Paraurantiacibacter namhicola]
MEFDKPSAIVAAIILCIAALSALGIISEKAAVTAFIITPTIAFAMARQQVCRLQSGRCAA